MATIDLSVVVAVYNEHPDNLVRLLKRLEQVLTPLSYEVVFVNDGSRAETSKALQQLASNTANVKLVVLSQFRAAGRNICGARPCKWQSNRQYRFRFARPA